MKTQKQIIEHRKPNKIEKRAMKLLGITQKKIPIWGYKRI